MKIDLIFLAVKLMPLSLEEKGAYISILCVLAAEGEEGDGSFLDDIQKLKNTVGGTTLTDEQLLSISDRLKKDGYLQAFCNSKILSQKRKKAQLASVIARKQREKLQLQNTDVCNSGATVLQNEQEKESEKEKAFPLYTPFEKEKGKEKEITADAVHAPVKNYAFQGKIIKLNQRDFDELVKNLPLLDIQTELFALDSYYQEAVSKGEVVKDWFWRMKKALANKHRELVKQKRENKDQPKRQANRPTGFEEYGF